MSFRNGKMIRGTHTTLNDLAAKVTDAALRIKGVTGVSPGMLQSGKGVAGGTQKVKIGEFKGGILLTVRQSRSVQELRVFSPNVAEAKFELAKALRNRDIAISFKREG